MLADDGDAPEPTDDLDLVVSVGGDGTFLRAAYAASHVGCPVLGVKVGRMGFLTEVEPADAVPLIRAVLRRHALASRSDWRSPSSRSRAPTFAPQWGLNEVMVEKHVRHRLVRLAVQVDGDYVTTFSADGVIVASPTGSTAYSFSARGPIVTPGVDSLVLTPIAAHMVFDRSFVLDADEPGPARGHGGGERRAVGRRTPQHRAAGGLGGADPGVDAAGPAGAPRRCSRLPVAGAGEVRPAWRTRRAPGAPTPTTATMSAPAG